MGTSQELAIGPVAVVSLLISSMISKLVDPVADPVSYMKLVFTVTFFTGTFQALFGLLRLGFLIDFLSHAAIVGFMAGAAIVIGLQQLKSLLGISHFTTKTDVVSVLDAVIKSFHTSLYPLNFVIGCSFLIFILITRFIGKRNKKLFWVPAISPVISVILSTLIVYSTRADEHGVKIIKHFKGGLNPSSLNQLEFNGPHLVEAAKAGFICAIIALTEAVAVGRSFASIKGYNLDGNKEMLAMGCMNLAGSMSSCYVSTGSFSRTAVNFSAGCQSTVSNIVMAITVFLSLQLLTKLLYYTPLAILASIILSALPGLIDYNEAYHIWKVDKMDFLACIGAFFGVLFASVEIGLLVALYPLNFVIGCSFLIFILITRFIGKRNQKLFWLPAISPVISVILSTLIVYLTRADEHGVKIIKHFKGGLNPSSLNQLEFNGPHLVEAAKAGFICAIIALTEAVAVGRSFASIKGYNLDGNKEMLAMGCMNLAGSMSSCYVSTGSFSRTAVNFSAGCQSTVSNIVMAITVFISLQLLTKLLYYTPLAILASIILSALPGLIDYNEAYHIWKVDKMDFLACIGAFFGVLLASVEIGLLVAVCVSFGRLILNAIRPGIEELGRFPGTDIFCDKAQYPGVLDVPGISIIRLNSGSFCFANANPIKEKITKCVTEENVKEVAKKPIIGIILDMSSACLIRLPVNAY
nr:low affinity sulfate transporter 3-like [Tanacetum cinerariifolium]